MAGGDREVTWKGFMAVMIPWTAALLGIAAFILNAHAIGTHEKSPSMDRFEALQQMNAQQHHVILEKIVEIKATLRELHGEIGKR